MKIAVIPARGGSKRIPHKNIKMFGGRPIIAWSIAAAWESRCFDRIIVSTDDPEIAQVALEFGAEAPFLRPAEISGDMAPTVPVVRHAIEEMSAHGYAPDDVCCIYATAPFVRAEDIVRGAVALAAAPNAFVFPVTTFAFPIQRALLRDAAGCVRMLDPDLFATRSQDLPETWHDAGQFYWASAQTWMSRDAVFSGETVGLAHPRHRVQDIDTLEDWLVAERLFEIDRGSRTPVVSIP